MQEILSQQQIDNYFASLNIELGLPNQDECVFLCPIHGDNTASASFNRHNQQWYCHACVLGGDLYEMEKLLCPDDPFPIIKERVDAICNGENRDNIISNLPEKKPLAVKGKPKLVLDVTFLYKFLDDETGLVKNRYAISRYHHADDPTKKSFKIWHKLSHDGPIIWGKPENFPLIPYHLHELQKASLVFVVEGEKCVDALRAVVRTGDNPDAVAVTCNPFGAGKWEDSFSQHLKDKTVIILPDNDAPGMKHAEHVAASVFPYAKEVRVGHVPMDSVGSDIADFLGDGHTVADVMAIVKDSKPWVQVGPTVSTVEAPVQQAQADEIPSLPEDAMYGWCGERAKELGTPIGYSYPAMLAVASVMCPNVDNTRSSLYVANIGPVGTAKSEAIKRARKTIAWKDEKLVIDEIPASDRGLFKLLADTTYTSRLLVCDELISLMNKVKIEGSTLASTLNTLWNHDRAGGATKTGVEQINVTLSICGGLICKDSSDFQTIFGKTTKEGLARRFIFGVTDEKDWCYMPKQITAEPQPMPYTVFVPDWCWIELHNWGKQDVVKRAHLKEPAMRIALVTSFANHDTAITTEAFQAALRFMEWQQAIREIYVVGEAENKDAELQAKIVRTLEKVGRLKRRDLHNRCHFSRYGAPMVTRVINTMVNFGILGFDKNTKEFWLETAD